MAYEQTLRTERSPTPVHLGYVHWGARQGMMLDVDRYGTIVELEIHRIVRRSRKPALRPAVLTLYPSGRPQYSPFEILHLRGRIVRVLKGGVSGGAGAVAFPAAVFYDYDTPGLRKPPTNFSGGWLAPGDAGVQPVVPGRVVALLPVEKVADTRDLGCIEGHVVSTDTETGKEYLEDLRHITFAKRVTGDSTLSAGLARDLLESGGLTAGYFVAEHAGWRVATGLLSLTKGAHGEASPAQLGLVEGLLRMRDLVRSGHYEARGWTDVDWDHLGRTLLTWAIVFLDAPRDVDLDTIGLAYFVLVDGICCGTQIRASDLDSGPDALDRVVEWLNGATVADDLGRSFAAGHFQTHVRTRQVMDWLRGDPAPAEGYDLWTRAWVVNLWFNPATPRTDAPPTESSRLLGRGYSR